MKKLLLFCFYCFAFFVGNAQQLPSLIDGKTKYKEGVEMFNKRLFGAAQRQFQAFITEVGHDSSLRNNDIYANAYFYDAICAYQLESPDLETRLLGFLNHFPEHSRVPYAQYCMGIDYFERYKYAEARSFLAAASETKPQFSPEEQEKMDFYLGYAYFFKQDFVNADGGYFTPLSYRKESRYYEDANYYHALCAYKITEYNEALRSFKIIENSPKYRKQIPIIVANILLFQQKYDTLYKYAEKLEKDKSLEDPQIYYIVANAAYQQKNYEKSNRFFDSYTKLGQKMDRTSLFRQGYSLYVLQEYPKAIATLEKVYAGKDSLTQAAAYYIGFSFLKQDRNENALYAYKKAAEEGAGTNPKVSEDAAFQYGKLCFATQNYSDAMAALRKFTDKYPTSVHIAESEEMIAEILSYSQNYPEALAYFEKHAPTTQRAKAAYQTCCYYYGIKCVENGDFAKAEKYLTKTTEFSQDEKKALSARFWLAEAKYKQKRFAEAINAYEDYKTQPDAAKQDDYALADYGLAWANFELKEYKYAVNFFELYLKNAKNDIFRKADAHLRMGDSYFIQKDYKKSSKSYSKVIDLNYIEQDYAFYQIAEGDYRQAKYENAVANFNKLITQYRNSEWRDNALDRIADIYFTWLDEPHKAKNFALTLIKEYPKNPLVADAYIRLAQIAYKDEDIPGAITYYNKVLSDFTSDTENCKIALENLSTVLEPSEYDRILNDYKVKNPNANSQLSNVTFKTAQDRFYANNYLAAIRLFTDFLSANNKGNNYWEALFLRAESYRLTTQSSLALKDYATIYNSPSQNAYFSKALDAAAKLKYEEKDFKGSMELYKTLEINSQRAENKTNALFGIARNQMALKDFQAAISNLTLIKNNAEVDVFTQIKADVWIANADYGLKRYEEALTIYRKIAAEHTDENGEESQFMIVKTLYTQNKFKESFEAGKFMKNNFADGQWKDRTILWMAEDCVALGDRFQAKSLLEGLATGSSFKDIAKFAQERLNKLKSEEK